jgi:hypothetical protein
MTEKNNLVVQVQCRDCLYFVTADWTDLNGYCHRNPPSAEYGFPNLASDDFCGEGLWPVKRTLRDVEVMIPHNLSSTQVDDRGVLLDG